MADDTDFGSESGNVGTELSKIGTVQALTGASAVIEDSLAFFGIGGEEAEAILGANPISTQLRIGMYEDLPPKQAIVDAQTLTGTIHKSIGTRAIISKKARDSYTRKAYFYIPDKYKKTMSLHLLKFGEKERQEFANAFHLLGSTPVSGFDENVDPFKPGSIPGSMGAFSTSAAFKGYVKFLLTNVQEVFEEKNQIVELLQDNYIPYFYGSRPVILTLSGYLVNSVHDQWKYWFLFMYQKIIKPSKLADLSDQPALGLWYEDTDVEGYPLNLSISHSSDMDTMLPFQMQFLVKNYNVQEFEQQAVFSEAGPLNVTPKTSSFLDSALAEAGVEPGLLDNPYVQKAIDAGEKALADAVEDFTEEIGLEAAAATVADIVNSNLNPAIFAQALMDDPVNAIKSAAADYKDAKSDVLLTQAIMKDAKKNPNIVKEEVVKDNIILGDVKSALGV
jgi:hypothetical protein